MGKILNLFSLRVNDRLMFSVFEDYSTQEADRRIGWVEILRESSLHITHRIYSSCLSSSSVYFNVLCSRDHAMILFIFTCHVSIYDTSKKQEPVA